MKKDYIITFITEFAVMATAVLVYRFAAVHLFGDGFSEYALSRRAISMVHPVLFVGLGIALPRAIALSFEKSSEDAYFLASLIVSVGLAAIFLVLINLMTSDFSYILFGSRRYSYMVPAIGYMILGITLHGVAYSYYRGRMQMGRANLLQLLNNGVMPVAAFCLSRGMADQVLYVTGLGWIVISSIFLFLIAKSITWKRLQLLNRAWELVSYGLRRVPGDFGLTALLSLPAYIITHTVGLREAGLVSFGTSLLSMISSAFAPIGLILLPKASKYIATGDIALLRRHAIQILINTFLATLTILLVFEFAATPILHLYLGKGYQDSVLISRILVSGALAYSIYISMRSIIDASSTQAINTRNILYSLIFFILAACMVLHLGLSYYYLLLCVPASLMILALLTLMRVKYICT